MLSGSCCDIQASSLQPPCLCYDTQQQRWHASMLGWCVDIEGCVMDIHSCILCGMQEDQTAEAPAAGAAAMEKEAAAPAAAPDAAAAELQDAA